MSPQLLSTATIALFALCLAGCGSPQNSTPATATPEHAEHDDAAERQANFAKLSDEDRSLAEAQGYCAVTSEPLGSMGPPLKLTLKDQPVFVCCKGCVNKARSNPDKTLAKVEQLKAKVKTAGHN